MQWDTEAWQQSWICARKWFARDSLVCSASSDSVFSLFVSFPSDVLHRVTSSRKKLHRIMYPNAVGRLKLATAKCYTITWISCRLEFSRIFFATLRTETTAFAHFAKSCQISRCIFARRGSRKRAAIVAWWEYFVAKDPDSCIMDWHSADESAIMSLHYQTDSNRGFFFLSWVDLFILLALS